MNNELLPLISLVSQMEFTLGLHVRDLDPRCICPPVDTVGLTS